MTYFHAERFTAFYNGYNSVFIRWPILILVLASLLIHVLAAIRIRRHNAHARKVGYYKHDKVHIPSIWVTLSISLLLLFILFHIWQTLNIDGKLLYTDMAHMFHSWLMLLIYLVGLFIMAMHMQHALNNVLQTLGITAKTYYGLVFTFVVLLTVGFAAVPVSIYLGLK